MSQAVKEFACCPNECDGPWCQLAPELAPLRRELVAYKQRMLKKDEAAASS